MALDSTIEKSDGVVETSSTSLGDDHQAQDSVSKKGSRLRRFLWDSLDKSPEERAFVYKTDWFIMSYVCVAYFVKYLDQTNVSRSSNLFVGPAC